MTIDEAKVQHTEALKRYQWAIIHGTTTDIVKASDKHHEAFMVLSSAAFATIGGISRAVIKYTEEV